MNRRIPNNSKRRIPLSGGALPTFIVPNGILSESNTQHILAGSLTETELYPYTLPGGTMGNNGSVEIEFAFTNTNSANNKTVSVYLGATKIADIVATTNNAAIVTVVISNRNSQSVQFIRVDVEADGAITGTEFNTSAENTAVDKVISITATTTLETAVALTGITRVNNVATAARVAHGFVIGNYVRIAGADQTDYNIDAVIFNLPDADHFDYIVANSPVTPATGAAITAQRFSRIILESIIIELVKP